MSTEGTLSETQILEIKKAFSMCDEDGNGEISSSELKGIVQAILKEEPSEEELAHLVHVMDQNGDGKISWEEFLFAMTQWFKEDYKARGSKKRKLDQSEEREEVHKRIKGFFTQFRKGTQFEMVRNRISASSELTFDTSERDALLYVYGQTKIVTSNAKLEFLVEYRNNLQNLDSVLSGVNSTLEEAKICEITGKMLSIVEIFSNSKDKRMVADEIITLFEKLVRANIASFFARVLSSRRDTENVYHVLKAITYFSAGPSIPLTPPDSILHPHTMYFKNLLISVGIPALIASHIQSSSANIIDAGLTAMGTLATNNPEVRDFLLENNVISILIPYVSSTYPITVIRKAAYAISVCCGVTHPLNQLPVFELVQPCFVPMAGVLYGDDEECLFYALNTFTLILPGIRSDQKFARRIIQLLSHPSPRIVKQALSTIDGVAKFDSIQTNSFISNGLLEALKKLIEDQDSSIRIASCECVCTLANFRDQSQAFIECGLVDIIIARVTADELVRFKILKLIQYLTRSSVSQIDYLVSKKCITALCNCLSYFKEYDEILSSTYKYVGPSYNFEFVDDIIVALDNIINAGSARFDGLNKFALAFDLDCIDKIRRMLVLIKDSSQDGLKQWRNGIEGQLTLEQKCQIVLNKVGQAHSINENEDKVSKKICDMIRDLNNDFFDSQADSSQKRFLIKCYFGDDIRVIEAPKDISFEELQNIIFHRFDRICVISYRDKESDLVKLDEFSFGNAIAENNKSVSNTLKLYLSEEPTATETGFGTPTYGSPITNVDSSIPLKKRSSDEPHHTPLEFGGSKASGPLAFNSNLIFPISQTLSADNAATQMLTELDNIKRQQKQHMFQDIKTQINIDNESLEALYDQWFSKSENGLIDKALFTEGMNRFGITDPFVVEQNFAAFDLDKDGHIDFREFAVSLSTLLHGSAEDKLQLMFRFYDLDGSGTLSPDEVYNIFKTSAQIQGYNASEEEIKKAVIECFNSADTNGDGQLSFEEFKMAIDSQKLLVNCLLHFPQQRL